MEAELDHIYFLTFDVPCWSVWNECLYLPTLSVHQMVLGHSRTIGRWSQTEVPESYANSNSKMTVVVGLWFLLKCFMPQAIRLLRYTEAEIEVLRDRHG